MRGLRGVKLYMSVSGGLGQVYDLLFALLARLRGMKLFMHHHSFAYLDIPRPFTRILIKVAGASAVHITLSRRMAERLKTIYEASQTVEVSNAVFCFRNKIPVKKLCKKLHTIGFISNISAEKGVFKFLDLMTVVEANDFPLRAKIAGPFHDSYVEQSVYMRLGLMKKVEYVGPKFGADKDDFYDHIDVLVFPTQYANEAEPLVVLEAMSRGIPIITYNRGCIPEIVSEKCGIVIDTNDDFVLTAIEKLQAWMSDPRAFEAASLASAHRFLTIYTENNQRWLELLSNFLNGNVDTKVWAS
jgi:glycosyltransferase involved in cell wall biosynthesis